MSLASGFDKPSTYVSADERAAETGGKLLYGLDKELAEKAAAKYDPEMEAEARSWVEAVLGEKLEGTFQEALKSGVVLCNLVNALVPGSCPPPKNKTLPFVQRENISNYLAACKKLGVPDYSSFQTVSLYENQDMMAVLTNIFALGGVAKNKGYTGPTIGVTVRGAADLASAVGAVDIADATDRPAETTPTPTYLQEQAAKSLMDEPARLAAEDTAAKAAATAQKGGYSAAAGATGMPSSAKATYVSADERAAETGGKLLYGLDKELAEKAAAKYDPEMEAEARSWVEAVLGEKLEGTFQEALKSGVVLCNLVNALVPGSCPPPKNKKLPFIQMENISNYLAACKKLGVPDYSSFQTVSLYENQDMMAVLTNIFALGSVAKTKGYSGPTIGVKMATENKRDFTEEQLKAGNNVQTFIMQGGTKTEAAALSHAHDGHAINKLKGVDGVQGLGTGGEETFANLGGARTEAASMSHAHDGHVIDKMKGVDGVQGLGTGGEETFANLGGARTEAASMSHAHDGHVIDKMKGVDGVQGLGTGGEETFANLGGARTEAASMSHAHDGHVIDKTKGIDGVEGLGTGGDARLGTGLH